MKPEPLQLPGGWQAALKHGQPVVAEWSVPAEGLGAQALASAFRRERPVRGPFYLLESQGQDATKRLSLITGEPLFVFMGSGKRAHWHSEEVLGELPLPPELAFHQLGRALRSLELCEARPGLVPLTGTLAYEAGARYEEQPLARREPLGLPEWHFVLPSEWAFFEPASGAWRFRSLLADRAFFSHLHRALGIQPVRENGFRITDPDALLADWVELCQRRLRLARQTPTLPLLPQLARPPIVSKDNHGKRGFMAMVRKAQRHIKAGDIYQANLSHRCDARYGGDPWDLYQRLAQIDPSPFAAFADLGPWQVVSASPERLFCQDGDQVEAWPIAGTLRRNPETAVSKAALLASEKDRAEHVMLVDLERNDLGRVCVGGSVQVPELMAIESTARVHHLVSRVKGRLRPGLEFDDLLRAGFPGGSITGAPKIRCMQIIRELERERRGLYTGSLGYWDPWHRKADFNILIRSLFISKGKASWQLGAGIVADSDPEAEWEETLAKGESLRQALGETNA